MQSTVHELARAWDCQAAGLVDAVAVLEDT